MDNFRNSKGQFKSGEKQPISIIIKRSSKLIGRKLSPEHIAKSHKNRKVKRVSIPTEFKPGKNHWNWKGGSSKFINRIYSLREFKVWRNAVFTRDNWTCQECGIKTNSLNCHHIVPISVLIQDFFNQYSQFSTIEDNETLVRLSVTYDPFWDISNGITLCIPCHKKTDTFSIKLNK